MKKFVDKFKKIRPPFESIDFGVHEWGTVLLMLILPLYHICRDEPKTSRWRLDLRLYKVNRESAPVKSGERYELLKEKERLNLDK